MQKTLYDLKKSTIYDLGLNNYKCQTLTNIHSSNNITPKSIKPTFLEI